jgi:hypothetical protein
MLYTIDSAYKVIKQRVITENNLESPDSAYALDLLKILYLHKHNQNTILHIRIDN